MKREALGEIEPDLLFLQEAEYDEAIIGVVEGFGAELRVAYDRKKLIDIIMRGIEGSDAEEMAEEHFQFNILGSYVGPHTPVYLIKAGELSHDS